jgi:hypothetical protein
MVCPRQSRLTIFLGCLIFPACLWLFSCASSEDKYGTVELFHGKPMMPRMIPRQVLGEMPSGSFPSHKVKGIMILDTGADYRGETSLTYMTHLLRRYRSQDGMGDIPFHYFIDLQGKIYIGRQVIIPAELHEDDPFLKRTDEVTEKDLLVYRLSRKTKPPINLDGYLTIALLGDYDKIMVNKDQEKALFQLVTFLCFQQYIPQDGITSLRALFPVSRNPGFYLNNYVNPSILEKNIPPIPRQPSYLRVPGKDG